MTFVCACKFSMVLRCSKYILIYIGWSNSGMTKLPGRGFSRNPEQTTPSWNRNMHRQFTSTVIQSFLRQSWLWDQWWHRLSNLSNFPLANQKPETFRNLLKFTLSMQQPAGPRVYVEYMDFPLNFTDLYWGVRRCNGWQSYMLFSGENQLMKLWSPEAKGSTGGPLLRLERSVQMGGPGFTANFPRPLGLHGWRMDKWI